MEKDTFGVCLCVREVKKLVVGWRLGIEDAYKTAVNSAKFTLFCSFCAHFFRMRRNYTENSSVYRVNELQELFCIHSKRMKQMCFHFFLDKSPPRIAATVNAMFPSAEHY